MLLHLKATNTHFIPSAVYRSFKGLFQPLCQYFVLAQPTHQVPILQVHQGPLSIKMQTQLLTAEAERHKLLGMGRLHWRPPHVIVLLSLPFRERPLWPPQDQGATIEEPGCDARKTLLLHRVRSQLYRCRCTLTQAGVNELALV